MFPEQARNLSANIAEGRNLIGMNVASYIPCKEANNYKTIEVIVALLQPRI